MSPPRKKRNDEEHLIQSAVIDWRELAKHRTRELGLLHAIPNGGHRHIAVAMKLKAEGVIPGIPDLHLPVARCGYHSIYTEIKTPKGRLTDAQRQIIAMLEAEGNLVEICRSSQAAIDTIKEYLRNE